MKLSLPTHSSCPFPPNSKDDTCTGSGYTQTLMSSSKIEQILTQAVVDTTPRGKILYLDTNHWIGIRIAKTSQAVSGVYHEIYPLLQQLARTRKVSIVASWPLLAEVHKQTEPTRSQTLEVMYELCGCYMVSLLDLDVLEFNSYPDDNYPQVWTLPANLLAEVAVSCVPRSPENQDVARKAQEYLTEFRKRITLKDFVEMHPAKRPLKTEEQRVFIEEQNVLIEQNRKDYPFRKLLLECWRSKAEQIVRRWKKDGRIDGDAEIRFLPNFYWPGCFIPAWLNAYVACDISGDRMRKGDDADFVHARLALPYCDYFFTDRRVRHLASVKPPGVRFALKDRKPMCRAAIIFEPAEILATLRLLR